MMTRPSDIQWLHHHHAQLADGQLLRGAHRLDGIPSVLIHARLDLGSRRMVSAYDRVALQQMLESIPR